MCPPLPAVAGRHPLFGSGGGDIGHGKIPNPLEKRTIAKESPEAPRILLYGPALACHADLGPYTVSVAFAAVPGASWLNNKLSFGVKGSECFARNFWHLAAISPRVSPGFMARNSVCTAVKIDTVIFNASSWSFCMVCASLRVAFASLCPDGKSASNNVKMFW